MSERICCQSGYDVDIVCEMRNCPWWHEGIFTNPDHPHYSCYCDYEEGLFARHGVRMARDIVYDEDDSGNDD